jgi:hypothetical protein
MSHIEEIIGRELRTFALVLAGVGFQRGFWSITWIGIHGPGIGQEPEPLVLHGLKPNQKLNLTRFKCFLKRFGS